MRNFKYHTCLLFFILFTSFSGYAQKQYQVLCYHNVVANDDSVRLDDISVKNLVLHFEWLKKEKYQTISVQDIIEGKLYTTQKQVILSFDDGYSSFYKYVYPLLKLYNFKAVVALVGTFQQEQVDSIWYTPEQQVPRSHFLTWAQINEMEESGLVEFVSHSFDLHKSVRANKQGTFSPAATTIQFDSVRTRFETALEYEERIRTDLKRSKQLLELKLKKFIPCIVWPYGRYNSTVTRIAQEVGFTYSFNLTGVANYSVDTSTNINRFYINNSGTVAQLRDYLKEDTDPQLPSRGIFLRSSDVISNSDSANENKLGSLLKQLERVGSNTVVIPILADSQSVYFANTYLPYQFNHLFRLIWQIQTRIGAQVALHIDAAQMKNLIQPNNWKSFWEQVGMQAPVRALIVESDEILDFFKNTLQERPSSVFTNSILQASNRKKYLSRYYNGIGELQMIESFMSLQPDVHVFLKIPINKSHILTDTGMLNTLLFYFSGIIVDGSSVQDPRVLQNYISVLQIKYQDINRIQLLLPQYSENEMKRLFNELFSEGIFSYFFKAADGFLDSRLNHFINTKDKALVHHE